MIKLLMHQFKIQWITLNWNQTKIVIYGILLKIKAKENLVMQYLIS